MSDKPPGSPALSDAALRETLDLLGQVVASMSEKIDTHGEQIDKIAAAMEQTRKAAQIAATQIDARTYAQALGNAMDESLGPLFDRLENAVVSIQALHETTADRLKELEQAENAELERLRRERDRAGRWRANVPFIWAAAVFAALVLGIMLSYMF